MTSLLLDAVLASAKTEIVSVRNLSSNFALCIYLVALMVTNPCSSPYP